MSLIKLASEFKNLKKNQVKLTPEERKEVMDAKAVWHFNGGNPSPAVSKSINKEGKIVPAIATANKTGIKR